MIKSSNAGRRKAGARPAAPMSAGARRARLAMQADRLRAMTGGLLLRDSGMVSLAQLNLAMKAAQSVGSMSAELSTPTRTPATRMPPVQPPGERGPISGMQMRAALQLITKR